MLYAILKCTCKDVLESYPLLQLKLARRKPPLKQANQSENGSAAGSRLLMWQHKFNKKQIAAPFSVGEPPGRLSSPHDLVDRPREFLFLGSGTRSAMCFMTQECTRNSIELTHAGKRGFVA